MAKAKKPKKPKGENDAPERNFDDIMGALLKVPPRKPNKPAKKKRTKQSS